ncbi:zinc finger A20 and AN1 domain-containing stress-associated protein 6-like [Salvia divinorum]|uniref:Zinc finger A20 and AN1 domain-containing stress-associated protein 6-like n=1 Tax=Salvia divinorum TaxID=28513 RepID=A0ABD1GPR9_SALDI
MAEEHGFQAPEGHRLCANNCGFFGSPATQNFCSKCYQDLCLKNSGDSTSVFPAPLTGASSSSVVHHAAPAVVSLPEKAEILAAPVVAQQSAANRCSTCRKKVGLTGFRCRCDVTFCGTHRYPEKHGCTFDFKSVGREAIAKANPLVKAEKLERI